MIYWVRDGFYIITETWTDKQILLSLQVLIFSVPSLEIANIL